MNEQAALVLTASAALLLVAARRTVAGQIEAGEGGAVIDPVSVFDGLETLWNQATETAANVDQDTAQRNIAAGLEVIKRSEGTAGRGDPYRVCYGYRHTIQSFAAHPKHSGEWPGERLSDQMCRNAGFGPGCISTAAGAYQIIAPTWARLAQKLGLQDFGPASQDAAAVELIRSRGALEDLKAGRFDAFVRKCREEWASLPGNSAKQGQHSFDTLAAWFGQAGGEFA